MSAAELNAMSRVDNSAAIAGGSTVSPPEEGLSVHSSSSTYLRSLMEIEYSPTGDRLLKSRGLTICDGDEQVNMPYELACDVGAVINMKLPGHASAGYIWEASIDGQSVYCAAQGNGKLDPDAGIGASADQRFTFIARDLGRSIITLELRRPWEVDVDPAKRHVFHADVTQISLGRGLNATAFLSQNASDADVKKFEVETLILPANRLWTLVHDEGAELTLQDDNPHFREILRAMEEGKEADANMVAVIDWASKALVTAFREPAE